MRSLQGEATGGVESYNKSASKLYSYIPKGSSKKCTLAPSIGEAASPYFYITNTTHELGCHITFSNSLDEVSLAYPSMVGGRASIRPFPQSEVASSEQRYARS